METDLIYTRLEIINAFLIFFAKWQHLAPLCEVLLCLPRILSLGICQRSSGSSSPHYIRS